MGSQSFLTCRIPTTCLRALLRFVAFVAIVLITVAVFPANALSGEDLQSDLPEVPPQLSIPTEDVPSTEGSLPASVAFDAFLSEEAIATPEAEAPPVPPVPSSEPMLAEPAEPLPGESAVEPYAPQTPGYWIVSSWNSPQEFENDQLRFCPQVRRVDECTDGYPSSMEQLKGSLVPGVPICIVIHGSFMDSPSVLPDSHNTYRWLKAGACGRPFQMIYFSWPSDRALSPLASIDVAILGSRASRNGFYLASLIQNLPPECPICLVGHSHGTRIISSGLHLLGGGVVEGHRHCTPGCSGRRIRVVYTASAIDHDWLNPEERYGRALCCVECLINLRNAKDPALQIYPLRRIGSSRALGLAGFTSKDRRELGAYGSRVRDWDVSSLIGHDHSWPNYVAHNSLASSLRNYLFFAN
jgi:hypothetical protein